MCSTPEFYKTENFDVKAVFSLLSKDSFNSIKLRAQIEKFNLRLEIVQYSLERIHTITNVQNY